MKALVVEHQAGMGSRSCDWYLCPKPMLSLKPAVVPTPVGRTMFSLLSDLPSKDTASRRRKELFIVTHLMSDIWEMSVASGDLGKVSQHRELEVLERVQLNQGSKNIVCDFYPAYRPYINFTLDMVLRKILLPKLAHLT